MWGIKPQKRNEEKRWRKQEAEKFQTIESKEGTNELRVKIEPPKQRPSCTVQMALAHRYSHPSSRLFESLPSEDLLDTFAPMLHSIKRTRQPIARPDFERSNFAWTSWLDLYGWNMRWLESCRGRVSVSLASSKCRLQNLESFDRAIIVWHSQEAPSELGGEGFRFEKGCWLTW